MKANSPICASEKPICTDDLMSHPVASVATKLFRNFPPTTIAETSRICGKHSQRAIGLTMSPIDRKKTAEKTALSGSISSPRRLRTSLDAPRSPTRKAPIASEKLNL